MHPGTNNTGAGLGALSSTIKNFDPKMISSIGSMISGDKGPSWLSNLLGNSNKDGFGNTVGQSTTNPTWDNNTAATLSRLANPTAEYF